jgi:hypothetical protein
VVVGPGCQPLGRPLRGHREAGQRQDADTEIKTCRRHDVIAIVQAVGTGLLDHHVDVRDLEAQQLQVARQLLTASTPPNGRAHASSLSRLD